MTTAAGTALTVAGRPAPGELRRVLGAVRVQALYWPTRFGFQVGRFTVVAGLVPIVVVPSILLGLPIAFAYCALLGLGNWQTITQVFPFAVGLGITRRTFHLATTLVAVRESIFLGTAYAVLAQIEQATGGWGSGERVVGVGELSPVELWAVYTALALVCAAIGVVLGAVYERWGPPAFWVLMVVVLAPSGLVVAVGTALGWWTAATALLAGVPITVLLAGAPLVLAVLLGLTGFAVLRRATP